MIRFTPMRMHLPLALLATCLLQGCVAIKSYPGPTLPDDQIARIGPQVGYRVFSIENVEIGSLDGSVIGEPLAVLEVLPGRHLVGTRYSGGRAGFGPIPMVSRNSTGLCYVVVDAKAGAFYEVGGTLTKDEHGLDGWQCWLADKATGVKTAGTFVDDRDLPQYESLAALMDAIVAGKAASGMHGGLVVDRSTQPVSVFTSP